MTLRKIEPPFGGDVEERLRWILEVLGVSERLLNEYTRILEELLQATRESRGLTSEELRGEMRRSTAVYHLNKLVAMGIVRRRGRKYVLRCSNLERTIIELKRDVDRLFEDLMRVAREIDRMLGLPGVIE